MSRPGGRTRGRAGRRAVAACLLLGGPGLGCGARDGAGGDRTLYDGYRTALEHVESALAATAGPEEIRRAGGVLVQAEGTKYAGAEGQGLHPDSASPGRFREGLAVDAGAERIGYAYRHDRYDGTRERLREVYGPGDRRVIHVLDQGFAVHLASVRHGPARRRLARRLPGLLLDEVHEQAAGLRWKGRVEGRDVVAATLTSGETLDLRFDPADGRLREAAYLADAPTFGDVTITWTFDDYREVPGLDAAVPYRYGVRLDERPFTRLEVRRVATGATSVDELLAPPEGIEIPEAEEVGPETDASAGARVREVAPGVYLAVNLRGGFHPMFVAFDDFVVAVDAPAGYPLWDELPASDVAPGPSSAWLSERFLGLIRETVPDRPVRRVVLTHHHNDHAGGVRAFVAEGTEVLAAAPTAVVVRRAVGAPHTLAPDRLALEGGDLELTVVEGTHRITDGRRTLEVIDVGSNPHTEHMLVVRLPEERIWFVSDLLDPVRLERYPKPEHAVLDRWFARWLEEKGHEPERIYTIHGSGLVTPEHLAKLGATGRDPPSTGGE